MQNTLPDIQRIKELCIDRAKAPGDFAEFARNLMSAGVFRHTYDVIEDCLYFYSKNSLIYRLPIFELGVYENELKFVIGDQLDTSRVDTAIQDFDQNKLSVIHFHQELAKAGVVYVSVFFETQIIYYLGQDGQHIIEQY